MSNKLYDRLKWIAQVFLPTIGAVYFTVATIWKLPYTTEILGTIEAVDAGLGILLGISSMNYQKALMKPKSETIYYPSNNDPMEDDLK